jgi:hypothetical protein
MKTRYSLSQLLQIDLRDQFSLLSARMTVCHPSSRRELSRNVELLGSGVIDTFRRVV